jgi:hypothetical protein
MGFSNHPPSGLFTNKFLQATHKQPKSSKTIKEDIHSPNSSIKATNNKIRSSTTK